MAVTRRRVIEGGMALGAAMLVGGCNRQPDQGSKTGPKPVGGDGFTLQMRFTGLFLFEIFERSHEMIVSFVDEAAVMSATASRPRPEVIEPHAAVMLVNLADEAYKWPNEYGIPSGAGEDRLPAPAPQIVRVGNEVYGMWGLHNRAVWVHSAHDEFYSADSSPSFSFPRSTEQWKGVDHFIRMADALPRETQPTPAEVPQIIPEFVKSRIRLTRGIAQGEVPYTHCERMRKYAVPGAGGATARRQYASEFTVSYPVQGSEVVLGFARRPTRAPRPGGRAHEEVTEAQFGLITLRGKPGATVSVSFANSPTDKYNHAHHFSAFYYALGQEPDVLESEEGDKCRVRVSPYTPLSRPGQARDEGEALPTPPDAGCIPPSIFRAD